MREFRVLVLDDDERVINQLKDRIDSKQTILDKTWDIAIEGVTIRVTTSVDGKSRFTDETLQELIKGCSEKPHLILADFGYATAQNIEKLQKEEITGQQYVERLLTITDLMPAVDVFFETPQGKEFLSKNPRKIYSINTIKANFQNNNCKIFLYSFTPEKIKDDAPSIEAREKRCQSFFRQSKVIAIDTRARFYNDNTKFFKNHDKDFYAFLVTGLLEQIVRYELLEYILHDETQRLKFYRYKRSVLGVLILAIVGGAIGAAGELVGDLVTNSFSNGSWSLAGFTIVLGIFTFFVIGLLIPYLFENTILKLLTKFKDEDWDKNEQ